MKIFKTSPMKPNYSVSPVIKLSAFILLWALISTATVFYYLNNPVKITNESIISLFLILFGAFISGFWARSFNMADKFLDKIYSKLENAFRGDNGEKQVADELQKILNSDQYTIYKNFNFSNKRYDIDFLIVGPEGLIALEVKNWSKPVDFYEGYYEVINWENKKGKNIFRPKRDPRTALINYCDQLQIYLQQNIELKIPIHKALILINEAVTLPKNSSIYIIPGIKNLKKYSFFQNHRERTISPETQAKLNQILSNPT